MSVHVLEVNRKASPRPSEVRLGFDPPLFQIFVTVFRGEDDEDDEPILSKWFPCSREGALNAIRAARPYIANYKTSTLRVLVKTILGDVELQYPKSNYSKFWEA